MNIVPSRCKLPLGSPSWAAVGLLLFLAAIGAMACGTSATPPIEPANTATPPIAKSPTPLKTRTPIKLPTSTAVVIQTAGNVAGTVVLTKPGDFKDIRVTATAITEEIAVETVARDLEVPWALDFAPDGRIFITERPGRIRIVQDGVLIPEPFATLEQVISVSESGLMGIALHPRFADNGYLYICYTYQDRNGQLRNRVARLTDSNGVGTDHQVILDDIPGAHNHNGCRIGFGPDGKLYVTTGDAQDGDLAQDLQSLAGKVLRLNADGSVPEDNPFIASYVYTYGHRNPQGLDWHPVTGDLFITEHGPDRNDEINILEPGLNYGWPEVTGKARSTEFVGSLTAYTPTPAIAGAAFYQGKVLHPSWLGSFVYATLKGEELRRMVLAPPDYLTVASEEVLVDGEYGRLRAVAVSPDGYLYFTTSNRDGRGAPQEKDDKLLRLTPVINEPPVVRQPDAEGHFALDLGPGYYHIRWQKEGFAPKETWLDLRQNQSFDLGDIVIGP